MTTHSFGTASTWKRFIAIGMIGILFISMFIMNGTKASAHGYIDSPGSRAALCKAGVNTNCGPIVYEPQSLEAPKGWPAAGPADGKIASAGGAFPALDEQSATRWAKVNMQPGSNTFTWKISARHATTSWKYYITKQDWNPNAPLSRDSFDLTPFCTVNYDGKQPPAEYSDTCNVPNRTGYQVILAVWEIADTVNAFYNVIDVNFSGSTTADTIAPTAPANLSSSNVTSTTATLTWGASTDNVGVSAYKIYSGSTLVGSTTNGSTLSYNLTGLTSNTSYTYTVKAVDAAGNQSASSNAVTFTTQAPVADTQAPTVPSNLHVMGNATASTVPLMWSASTDNVAVTGYQVYQGTTLLTTVSGSALEYLVSGLTANTAYSFSVKAIDAAGNVSAASNVVNATTASAPTTYAAWSATATYVGGDKVTYNGVNYEAKWWTYGQIPGSQGADVWKVIQ